MLALSMAFLATSALAEDKKPCAKGMICASDPASVAKALGDEGYQAKLSTDKQGDPTISSAAAGYTFDIYFYGCVEHKNCDSLQFYATFERDASSDVVKMNEWNKSQRFSQMSVDEKGVIALDYDVSTYGGLNKDNFADVLSWWSTILGEASKFFAKNREESKPPAPKG